MIIDCSFMEFLNQELLKEMLVSHLIKAEMNIIDKNLMDGLRNEAKNNKVLSSIVAFCK